MKRHFYNLLLSATLVALMGIAIVPAFANAQAAASGGGGGLTTDPGNSASYVPLAPLPYADPGPQQTQGLLQKYLPGVMKLAIAITIFLSVLMIMYGGFQYITSTSLGGKSGGRNTINNAVIGLILAFVSWLILYTINPNLVSINLDLTLPAQPQNAVTAGGTTGGTGGITAGGGNGGGAVDPALALSSFNSAGFDTNANCVTQPGCKTSLIGIQKNTVEGANLLKSNCSACTNLVITGGTEPGHTDSGPYTHANGYKLDISDKQGDGAAFSDYMDSTIKAQLGTVPPGNTWVTITQNGYTYKVAHEDIGQSNSHWDIQVNK
ncbi:MAG TPA: pilin [Candidatus Paceibacterota bacterium]|jgi:hypothetical protein|nr:pilin [Candidatus Paceibacterota bacterium]